MADTFELTRNGTLVATASSDNLFTMLAMVRMISLSTILVIEECEQRFQQEGNALPDSVRNLRKKLTHGARELNVKGDLQEGEPRHQPPRPAGFEVSQQAAEFPYNAYIDLAALREFATSQGDAPRGGATSRISGWFYNSFHKYLTPEEKSKRNYPVGLIRIRRPGQIAYPKGARIGKKSEKLLMDFADSKGLQFGSNNNPAWWEWRRARGIPDDAGL